MSCTCGNDCCNLTQFMSTNDVVSWQADPPEDDTNIQRAID